MSGLYNVVMGDGGEGVRGPILLSALTERESNHA